MFEQQNPGANLVRSVILGAEEIKFEPHQINLKNESDKNFPESLTSAAFHGVIGDIAESLAPHTEADPAALMIMSLVACGTALGCGPYYNADGSRHGANLFACIVGNSGKARKGTAWQRIKNILLQSTDNGFEKRVEKGLSSGEGLIHLVRDASEVDDEDIGVNDKRLLIVQSEFSSPLKVMRREGNTLSAIIREAWDGERLRVATKNSPMAASDPHIGIIGHITREELARNISETEAANGFGNRFLWVAARRSKCLPFGGNLDQVTHEILVSKLRDALLVGARNLEYKFDLAAREKWIEIYPVLSDAKPGLMGAMIARGEGQVVRLAMLYAALDGTAAEIRLEHLNAALAIWEYCERSACWAFGNKLGDPIADSILEALDRHASGMTRTEISNHLGRNINADRISIALQFLQGHGKALMQQQKIDGAARPVERWVSITNSTKFTNR